MTEKKTNIAEDIINGLRNVWPTQGDRTDNELNASLFTNPLFLNFINSSPAGISIFSYESLTYEYYSPNLLSLLGYPLEKLQGADGAEFIINTFRPEHRIEMHKMMELVKQHYYTYAMQKRIMDTRFTWTVQVKKANGDYIWTLQQTTVLEENAEGFPLRVLIFVSDISDVKTNSKVDFVFSLKNKNEKSFETVYMAHYDPATEYVLSERELEIVNCVGKGMTNQEIADALFISKHTVITHRKNIVKKSGKDNIIQLLLG